MSRDFNVSFQVSFLLLTAHPQSLKFTALLQMDKLLPVAPESIDTSGSPVSGDLSEVPQDKLVLSEHEKMGSIHISDCTARILEIFPDVEPDHITALVVDTIQIYGTGTMEWVLHTQDIPRSRRKGVTRTWTKT